MQNFNNFNNNELLEDVRKKFKKRLKRLNKLLVKNLMLAFPISLLVMFLINVITIKLFKTQFSFNPIAYIIGSVYGIILGSFLYYKPAKKDIFKNIINDYHSELDYQQIRLSNHLFSLNILSKDTHKSFNTIIYDKVDYSLDDNVDFLNYLNSSDYKTRLKALNINLSSTLDYETSLFKNRYCEVEFLDTLTMKDLKK